MEIHWHEGLFLLPHHLQRSQRNTQTALIKERRLLSEYPYGVIEAKISPDNLENLQLQFDRLRALMPSGIEVNFPRDADLPTRGLKDALQQSGAVTVYLAVPTWLPSRANCILPGMEVDPRTKLLYRVVEENWPDENTGSNERPLLHRRVNARLLFEGEDQSDLEVIPLLRVVRSGGEEIGMPKQDMEYVGPCLLLRGSASLFELCRDLLGQIQASREELLVRINRGGFSMDTLRGMQIEQILRLQTLNRFSVRLNSLLAVGSVSPFTVYLELQDLLAELSGLYPQQDMAESPAYDHDNPYPCFNEIARRVRMFLRGAVTPNFIRINFKEADEGFLAADLEDEHFTAPTDYLLGITTREDPLSLAKFVENVDQFKLMPASMANRAVRGVALKEERFPPLELPSHGGLYYFRVSRSESPELWAMIKTEKKAVVRWSDRDDADYQVALYMTLAPSA